MPKPKPCPFGCGGKIWHVNNGNDIYPEVYHRGPDRFFCPAEGQHQLDDWERRDRGKRNPSSSKRSKED